MTFWASMLLVLVADQLSKYWVMTTLNVGESRPFIDHVLNITYVHNPGAAFSILTGKSWISLICAALVVGAILYFIYEYKPARSMQFSLGIIAGGAIGNFMDRYLYAYVRDFFDLGWFPVFNVADIGIVCGGILLIVYLMFMDGSEKGHERD
jgi:signal peptidase II